MIKTLTGTILPLSFVALVNAQECFDEAVYLTTPMKEFVVHGDGTVSHLRTGLMWKQCLQGTSGDQCQTGEASLLTWEQAFTELKAVNQDGFGGHNDWRLPNAKELSSIIEYGCHDPALNITAFPNMTSNKVWSSTPLGGDMSTTAHQLRSWFADYGEGEITFLNADRVTQKHAVHLVRGAQ